jgi:transcriptional regulator with XRE-family HTH domain
MSRNPLNELGSSLGDYLREQRQSARLSLRQLSELAGISNPYLSQIERGLKRPSAEILKELAKGLEVSAESLYIKAGILDEEAVTAGPRSDVRRAIAEDPALTARQKASLLDFYESFVGKHAGASSTGKTSTTGKTRSTTKRKTSGSTPATTRTTKEK